MRVLLVHSWCRPDPAFCVAARAACAHLAYLQARGDEVHVVLQEIPAWGAIAGAADELLARLPGVKSVRMVRADYPPVAPREYGDEFRQLLYANERAARSAPFHAVAAELWDAFIATDVTCAPFAAALPHATRKVLVAHDSHARRAAAAIPESALREAEHRFAFARVEAELYRLFDRVLFASEAEAAAARRHGAAAVCVPPAVERPTHPSPTHISVDHDLLISGGERSGELADLEWFYRHVYVPYLRARGVRLTIAGPLAARFPVCDLRVAKLAGLVPARVIVAPTHEAAGPSAPALDALAAGHALVATPVAVRGLNLCNGAEVIDIRADAAGTARVLLELLADADRRRAMGERAGGIATRHTRERLVAALDRVWDAPTLAGGRP